MRASSGEAAFFLSEGRHAKKTRMISNRHDLIEILAAFGIVATLSLQIFPRGRGVDDFYATKKDDLVKSPISALRCILCHCGVI